MQSSEAVKGPLAQGPGAQRLSEMSPQWLRFGVFPRTKTVLFLHFEKCDVSQRKTDSPSSSRKNYVIRTGANEL